MLHTSSMLTKIRNFFRPIIDCLLCIFCCWRVRKEDNPEFISNTINHESVVNDIDLLDRKIAHKGINGESPSLPDNTLISNAIQANENNENYFSLSDNLKVYSDKEDSLSIDSENQQTNSLKPIPNRDADDKSEVDVSSDTEKDHASIDSEDPQTNSSEPIPNRDANDKSEEDVFSDTEKVKNSQEDLASIDSENSQTNLSDIISNENNKNREGVFNDKDGSVELSPPITSGVSDKSKASEGDNVLISRKKIDINDDHIEKLRNIGFDNESLLNKDILQTIANSGYELLTKIISDDVVLHNINEKDVALLANYFYLLALVHGQEFTDGAYKIITVDKDSLAIERLFSYLSSAKDVYRRPSSHMVEQSDSYTHSGIDLTEGTILPLNHKHILFTTFEDAGVTKLFFKPEHYGMRTIIDSVYHTYEWVHSLFKRMGLISQNNDDVTTVNRKERVKYLQNDKKTLIDEFIELLDTVMVDDTSILLDDDDLVEYSVCNTMGFDKSGLAKMKENVLKYGFSEIARLVESFLTNAHSDEIRNEVSNHFGPLIQKIQKEYADYEYRSANEIVIAI